MKKYAIIVLVLIVFLAGCSTKKTLKDGRYVPKDGNDETAVPYLLVQEGEMHVIQDIAISFQPSGDLVIDGDEVSMDCVWFNDQNCRWVFRLTGNNTLEFQLDKSTVPAGTEQLWTDGMVFVLAKG
ncbi:MAG: hypothetical protein IJM15_05630 [Erysipelotrichaceae bacterium]|nr:hypothetical protein [Erysipelotrichaceae bacterium]